jgi:hypothetical protein
VHPALRVPDAVISPNALGLQRDVMVARMILVASIGLLSIGYRKDLTLPTERDRVGAPSEKF